MVAFIHTLLGVALAYLIGSIPFGFLLGKANGVDIREHGSGNIGATNLTRTIGKEWGRLCFVLDFLKGLLPVLLLPVFFNRGHHELLQVLCAAATVLGHVFPLYLHFKGGKGVSTTLGALVALSFWAVLIGMAVWGIVFKTTRYVSVASMSAAVVMPLAALILPWEDVWTRTIFIALGGLIIVRHTSNIIALRNGTERRFTRGDAK